MKARLFVMFLAMLGAGPELAAQSASSVRLRFTDIAPPTPDKMALLCKGTDDLRACGKLIEQEQLKAAAGLVERRGRVLSIALNPTGRIALVDEGGAEGGESFSFFGYHAIADAVTLYHTKADKLGFIVLSRRTGTGSALPNEPIFHSGGEQFLTVDICPGECEQRITWWKIKAEGVRRHAEFIVPSSWSDASAAWTPSGSVWIEYVSDDGKRNTELTARDSRWIFAP